MVRLSRIYTKTGDAGETGLGSGLRVRKDHARVEAYGDVDEANAALGVCVVAAEGPGGHVGIATLLKSIQHDMFDCGADLCTPIGKDESAGPRLRVTTAQTERLEKAIDQYNAPLKALESFVLPGGTALAAALHVARTVTRRAERRVVTLLALEPGGTNPEALKYLNRLSDLLFVLARAVNVEGGGSGKGDVLWKPGANR
jgi:cob(I)alamin adenosyltransferase